MQGIATIAPSFAILASFVFIVSFAGVVTPWAYLFGGALLALQALNAAQLAKVFPSAGGWYTWIARALHPRAGFFAGVLFSVWLPPVGALTLSFLAKTVLEPSIKAEYSVTIYWWIWVLAGLALVIYFAYQGIVLSEKALIITGTIEILIMVALAFTGLADPGPGGFSFAPLNPGNFGLATNLFLGVVFSIFAFSGWESTGPLAEESKNPKRNVPIGLVGSVIILMIYFVLVTWGYLVGIGVNKVAGIPTASAFPVATLAQRVWGSAWVFLLFALLNSAIAVSIACFNGGTRTWYAMGRSGVLPSALGKVNPTKKTPVNAIHLEVAMQVVAFACVLIFGRHERVLHLGERHHDRAGADVHPGQHRRGQVLHDRGEEPVQLCCCTWSSRWSRRRPASWWCGSPTSRRSRAPGPSTGACWCSRGAGDHHRGPDLPAGHRQGGLDAQGAAGLRAVGRRPLGPGSCPRAWIASRPGTAPPAA